MSTIEAFVKSGYSPGYERILAKAEEAFCRNLGENALEKHESLWQEIGYGLKAVYLRHPKYYSSSAHFEVVEQDGYRTHYRLQTTWYGTDVYSTVGTPYYPLSQLGGLRLLETDRVVFVRECSFVIERFRSEERHNPLADHFVQLRYERCRAEVESAGFEMVPFPLVRYSPPLRIYMRPNALYPNAYLLTYVRYQSAASGSGFLLLRNGGYVPLEGSLQSWPLALSASRHGIELDSRRNEWNALGQMVDAVQGHKQACTTFTRLVSSYLTNAMVTHYSAELGYRQAEAKRMASLILDYARGRISEQAFSQKFSYYRLCGQDTL